ncbi:MAG: glycosyltransferase N-terminal domain-containing protein, partial [Dehalococcoidia bacterium]|nr:glycosyltransferase N-terminal domain-containing protein [Dehalococcoidia bacterium]
MWWLYELLLVIGLLAYLPKALWRRRLPHPGWRMRLGRYPEDVRATLGRPSVWVHAVSVGEVLAARPLLEAFAARGASPLVLSTVTPGGFEVARQQPGALPVYFPLDLRPCVRRAIAAVNPRVLMLMESELWPLVILELHARGTPVAVVNGRISPRAYARYKLIRPWLRGTLGRVRLFLMQSEEDARRVVALGAPQRAVRVVGSLKWDASLAAAPTPGQVVETAGRLGLTPEDAVLVGGSTHRGEERALVDAFASLRAGHPRLRLILAPRHLERLAEVEQLVQAAGLSCARTSAMGGRWDVALVDAFGQLPRYYSLARITVVGGSFIPHGGQNPLEPASLG